MVKDGNFYVVKKVFDDYMDANGLRKTAERYAILKEIYSHDEHMDVDTLHFKMRSSDFRISRATIYNNLDLLIDAKLIRRHQFSKNTTHYEKCYFQGQHDHIIFTDTGEVKEFCDPRIHNIKKTIEETFGVKVNRHSLYFYATKKNESESIHLEK
ncbi:MAG: Fur family transcriptional regulator [Bacteroidota bacterium]